MTETPDFDLHAAWLRRFHEDVESNINSFALRLKEAMPDLVIIYRSRTFFSKGGKITGLTVDLGERQYRLDVDEGRLKSSIAMVVRGITLNTKAVEPVEWFESLSEETKKMSKYAQALSGALSSFMGG